MEQAWDIQSTSLMYRGAPQGPRLPGPARLYQSHQLPNRAPINPSVPFQLHSSLGLIEDNNHYRNTSKYWDPLSTKKLDRRDIVYHEKDRQAQDLAKVNTSTWIYRDEHLRDSHQPVDNSTLTSEKKAWDGKAFSMIQENPDGKDAWKKSYYANKEPGQDCPMCDPSLKALQRSRYGQEQFIRNTEQPDQNYQSQYDQPVPHTPAQAQQGHRCPAHCRGSCNPLNR